MSINIVNNIFVRIKLKTTNVSDIKDQGSATMPNGDFLTYDGLTNNKFTLLIPKLPHVTFFLQGFSLPNVSVNEVGVPTRFVDYNEIGEKMNYVPFTVNFLVDKYTRNWSSIYNWMKEMTVSGSNVGYSEDIVLMLNGNEFIRFVGAWPTSLSGVNLDATVQELVYVKAAVTFNYDYFDLINSFSTDDSVYN